MVSMITMECVGYCCCCCFPRLNLVPSLVRMRNEFLVFRDSAVTDLDMSIQQLEKARTEYRAALLWMRDVSDKLQNPDYKDQLIRFREVRKYTHTHTRAHTYTQTHSWGGVSFCCYSYINQPFILNSLDLLA